MTKDEAIKYIENYTWSKTKLGLSRTRELLAGIGDPQKKLRFVHVAGSNGKGSTCAMLAHILAASGLKVGFYSSPYIQDFCERIQIVCRGNDTEGEKNQPSCDNIEQENIKKQKMLAESILPERSATSCDSVRTFTANIPAQRLAEVTSKVREVADGMSDHPSQFELVTAIGFQYFLEEACDVVVLEVGMGGEFDSTNVIDSPDACVITNIGLEHTEYLGDTIEEIARAKSGIIKPGADVICYDSTPEAVDVIREMSEQVGAKFHLAEFGGIEAGATSIIKSKEVVELVPCSKTAPDEIHQQTSAIAPHQDFIYGGTTYRINLLGTHQLKNAAVAIDTAKALSERGDIYSDVTDEIIRQGLAQATWPAIFEILQSDPLFILDGGHNPQCAMALAESLGSLFPGEKFVFVAGILADKKYEEVIDIISPYASAFACLTPDNPRALSASELAKILCARGIDAKAFEGESGGTASVSAGMKIRVTDEAETTFSSNPVKSAIDYACKLSKENGSAGVVAFGSLYMAGKIRDEFLPSAKN